MDRTENDAIIQHAIERARPEIIDLLRGDSGIAHALVVPKGSEVRSLKPLLDEYLPQPERRRGTTMLSDPASFTAFVKRAANPDSLIYCDDTSAKPVFVAVLDHDAQGPDGATTARWQQHRATYAVEISDEWAAWTKADNNALTQRDFAELVEDRALDLLDPTDAPGDPTVALAEKLGLTLATAREVIEASRGLKLRAEVNVGEAIVLQTGETELHFTEVHKAADGSALKVPPAFLIGVPVLRRAPRDVLLVRLRYRRVPGQPRVAWCVNLHRPDEVLRNAIDEVAATIARDTGVTVLRGSPPAAK